MKKITRKIFRFLQKVLLTVSLALLYLAGFGIARLFLSAAAPRLRKEPESYWRSVPESAADINECKEQS